MASTQACSTCQKTIGKMFCTGCNHYYCATCFGDHRKALDDELETVINERDLIKEILGKSCESKSLDAFKETIDKWEHDMFSCVKKTADNARRYAEFLLTKTKSDLSSEFDEISQTLKEIRDNKNYVDTDIARLKNQLRSLNRTLNDLTDGSDIIVIEDKSDRISWHTLLRIHSKFDKLTRSPQIPSDATWSQNATTIISDICRPWALAVDQDDDIVYVADWENKRIVSWDSNTNKKSVIVPNLKNPSDIIIDKERNLIVIADYGNKRVLQWSLDNSNNQRETIVDHITCYGLAMDIEGSLYVSDIQKDEVRKFSRGHKTGILVAGGNGKGSGNHQLNNPNYIALDNEGSIYVSDYGNDRVMKWIKGAKEGIIVAGGHGSGSNNNQLSYPQGIVVDLMGNIYVAEGGNNRVTRWRKGERVGEILVGGTGRGDGMNQLKYPIGLSFDRQNNLYVVDNNNKRIQRFLINDHSCTHD